jgi:hypothetical protein
MRLIGFGGMYDSNYTITNYDEYFYLTESLPSKEEIREEMQQMDRNKSR